VKDEVTKIEKNNMSGRFGHVENERRWKKAVIVLGEVGQTFFDLIEQVLEKGQVKSTLKLANTYAEFNESRSCIRCVRIVASGNGHDLSKNVCM
jgi:hypothetical protein